MIKCIDLIFRSIYRDNLEPNQIEGGLNAALNARQQTVSVRTPITIFSFQFL